MTNRDDKHAADRITTPLLNKASSSRDTEDGKRCLTLFRVGAMTVDGHRELCLIRNISTERMEIRPYCELTKGAPATIELKTGFPVPCVIASVRDGSADLEFTRSVDVAEILSPVPQGPRPRMPRIDIDCFATVRDGSTVHRMRVHDVSQGGVKLQSAIIFESGANLVVSLPGLEPRSSAVRWSEGGYVGVTFNRLLPLTDLVEWLHATRTHLRSA